MNELTENIENLSNINNLKEIVELQNLTIKKLKSQIDVYKMQIKEQSDKISSCDHLIIDYNSLINNYSKIEKEISFLKNENNNLKILLNTKNKSITEYESLFLEVKSKFILFDKLNSILQNKIKYLELKLKSSNIINSEIDQKLNEYNLKIKKIKDEYSQNLKNGLNSENGIDDIKLELLKNIKKDTDIDEFIKKNEKLEEEKNYLKEILIQKENDMKKIILNIKNENDIKEKEIKKLLKEKEELFKKINNKEVNNLLIENSFKKKYEELKEIVDNIEKEKNNIQNNKDKNIDNYKNEITRLKNEINKYFINDKENLKKCEEIENKFKKVIEEAKISDERYKKEIRELNNIILELKKEKEINIKKNNELKEKNKNLNETILNIRKNFKNFEKEKINCSCPYDNICTKCGYSCNAEFILCDCCCNCKFKNNFKYLKK